jgi:hypothetical protein
MISFVLIIYDQAHGRAPRIFNNLAVSYDQAHGSYDQAHGPKIERLLQAIKNKPLTGNAILPRARIW